MGMERSIDDPAVALLHGQAAACEISLDSIVDKIPGSQSEDSFHGTTKHVWDEERTRFLPWRRDLVSVIAEIHQQNPAQARKIAKSNILANLRDLASDLIEGGRKAVPITNCKLLTDAVLTVVDGSRLPLEEQDSECESLSADEGDDEPRPCELVERLDAVNSTINGLTRMLKLQYSYALENVEDDGRIGQDGKKAVEKHELERSDRPTKWPHDSAVVTSTGTAPYIPGYEEAAPPSSWNGPLEPLFRVQSVHETGWVPPRLGWSGLSEPTTMSYGQKSPTHDMKWMPARPGEPDRSLKQMKGQSSAPRPASATIPYRESMQHSMLNVDDPSSYPVQSGLHSSYKLRPTKFFKVGRVLMVLWTEPAGESGSSSGSHSSMVSVNERVYAKVRRFIVVKERVGHVLGVPVLSYNGRGVDASRRRSQDHAMVYTGAKVPQPMRNEGKMLPIAIRVIPDEPGDKLAPSARINFGKIYTIETNIKCKGVGMVDAASLQPLLAQHLQVLMGGENSSQSLSGIAEEEAASAEEKSRSLNETELDVGDPNTHGSSSSQALGPDTIAPALRPLVSKRRMGQGSDSGYGESGAATEARSMASSLSDDHPTERIKEVDDLGPGRILTYIDEQKLEVPVLDPDNPTSDQLRALSDSSIQILLDSVLSEQQKRLQLRPVQG